MAIDTQEFVIKGTVPAGVSVLQIDDGTLFYWRYSSPQRLYVIRDGEEIDALLPEVTVNCDIAHGDAVYFSTKIRIFKTVTNASGRIEVAYVRHFLKDERDTTGGMLSRVREDGKKYAYGMWDDPQTGGVVVEDDDNQTRAMRLDSTIRKDIIYLTRNNGSSTPTVRRLRKNAVVVEIPSSVSTDDRKNCPFYYFTCNQILHALNTETMTLLPPLKLKNVDAINSFAGIINGVITLKAEMSDSRFLVTAQLPKEYWEFRSSHRADNFARDFVATQTIETCVSEMSVNDDVQEFDDLTDQCCCTICSEVFDSTKIIPRVLDCGHTFCESCLYNDSICRNNLVTCPNCARVINIQGKVLPVNYTIIGMAEQLMKTRADPKVACKECKTKHPTSAVRLCAKNDCAMYNQLLCLSCVVDGGHGGHVVKYDVRMEKIRNDLRAEIDVLCSQMEQKRQTVLDKARLQLRELETKLGEAKIPANVIGQLNSIASVQEAKDYQEIVRDLAKTQMTECDALAESFAVKLTTATALL